MPIQGFLKFIDNIRLRPHEHIREEHVKELLKLIKKDGFLNNPIIVDEHTLIILDGHHRFQALKRMGLTKIPCFLVDYKADAIQVLSWRDGENVSKQMVIHAGLSGTLLQPKTSRHVLPERPENLKIPLTSLR